MLLDVEISSTSEIMLDLADTGTDPSRINFSRLVQLPAEHAVISDVRDLGGRAVQQHAYMAYFDGQYWVMGSDGPGDPRPGVSPERHRGIVPGHDLPHQRVSYATSADGVHWSPPKDLSGPPRIADAQLGATHPHRDLYRAFGKPRYWPKNVAPGKRSTLPKSTQPRPKDGWHQLKHPNLSIINTFVRVFCNHRPTTSSLPRVTL